MLSIPWKNMRAEKARFAFSVLGIAVAALLLAFMIALYRGWNDKIASYVADVPADIWVSQPGNQSFFSASIIADTQLAEVGKIEGVTEVSSLLGRSLKVTHGSDEFDSYILGFDADGIGGPIHIKKGSGTPGDGEIVMDDVLARTQGIGIGDEVVANERRLRVVGISTGGNVVINQLSFVSKAEAQKLVGITGVSNFGLVQVERGKTQDVLARINDGSIAGVNGFDSKTFAHNSRKVLQKSVLPILTVVVLLVFIVGAVIVGLTMYTATLEKEREYGVMKALGTPNKFLFYAVLAQSLICGLVGFVVGEALVVAATRFAERLVPQFVTLVRWQDALIVLAAVVIMSLLAAYLPVQRVMRVDPLRVFKA